MSSIAGMPSLSGVSVNASVGSLGFRLHPVSTLSVSPSWSASPNTTIVFVAGADFRPSASVAVRIAVYDLPFNAPTTGGSTTIVLPDLVPVKRPSGDVHDRLEPGSCRPSWSYAEPWIVIAWSSVYAASSCGDEIAATGAPRSTSN